MIVGILDELGVEHPLARESRRRLAVSRCTSSDRRASAARRRTPLRARRPVRRAAAPAAARRTRAAATSATGPTRSAEATGSESVRARVCVEKSSSRTLIPIVRPRRPWAIRVEHSRVTRSSSTRSSSAELGDVEVERRLARLGDHLALLASPASRPRTARAADQLAAVARAEPLRRARPGRAARELRRASDPQLAAAARRSSARSRAPARAAIRANRSLACSAVSTTNPRGFSASDATFATSLFGPIPTEQLQPGPLLDPSGQPPHRRVRREQPGQLQIGLVESHDLDRLGRVPHDRHHLARRLAVVGEVGLKEDARRGTAAARVRPGSPTRPRTAAPRTTRS